MLLKIVVGLPSSTSSMPSLDRSVRNYIALYAFESNRKADSGFFFCFIDEKVCHHINNCSWFCHRTKAKRLASQHLADWSDFNVAPTLQNIHLKISLNFNSLGPLQNTSSNFDWRKGEDYLKFLTHVRSCFGMSR